MIEGDSVLGEYSKNKMTEEIADIIKGVEAKVNGHSKEDIVKTIPAKSEWVKLHDELEELGEEALKMVKKVDSKKKLLWSTIENDLDEYRDMTWNHETNEVEIFKDKDHDHGDKGRKVKKITIKPN